jgi:hypothetical protein
VFFFVFRLARMTDSTNLPGIGSTPMACSSCRTPFYPYLTDLLCTSPRSPSVQQVANPTASPGLST